MSLMSPETRDLMDQFRRLAESAFAYHVKVTDGLVKTYTVLDDAERALSESWEARIKANKLLER